MLGNYTEAFYHPNFCENRASLFAVLVVPHRRQQSEVGNTLFHDHGSTQDLLKQEVDVEVANLKDCSQWHYLSWSYCKHLRR